MIHEYAQGDLRGTKGVRGALGISVDAQEKLRGSANNLSPLEGGRHAQGTVSTPWSLEEQRAFTADLLKRWIQYRASAPAGAVPESLAVTAVTHEAGRSRP